MKALLSKLILIFSLTGFLIGCNSGTKRVSENNIRFDSLAVDRSYHLLNIETNPKCSLQIKFVYPVDYPNREILLLMQQQFIAGFFGNDYVNLSPKDAAEHYANDFIEAYKAEENNFKTDRDNHGTELIESWYSNDEAAGNQIVFNQNDIISIVVFRECYYGGAHGSHQFINMAIDLKTGRRITEDDIFTDDYQDNLANLIVSGIALSNHVEAAELENIGFFNVGEIYPNKNFSVDKTGITYTFNEYEIAAYAVGAVSVHIPYEKIRHLLRKESPVSSIAFQ